LFCFFFSPGFFFKEIRGKPTNKKERESGDQRERERERERESPGTRERKRERERERGRLSLVPESRTNVLGILRFKK
jgi:hypothetical protein